jgi:hypothetical protein
MKCLIQPGAKKSVGMCRDRIQTLAGNQSVGIAWVRPLLIVFRSI